MGLFGKLFSSNSGDAVPDFSAIYCDMHSHFIPKIDDGSQAIEDSVELIRGLYNMGYKKIVTTPHIMSDSFRNTPEIILKGLETVKEAIKNAGIPVELHAAAEYYADFEFEHKIETGGLLTFGDNYVLFEVSYLSPPDNFNNIVFKLQTNGYKPVLAHPERYNFWHKTFDKYKELKEKGIFFQLNINSLTGHYSMPTKRIAEQLIDNNLVDFAGTDCHHAGHIELLRKAAGNKYLKKLVESGKLINKKL